MLNARTVTTRQAIEAVLSSAMAWAENAEESLPQRISPEILENDELWIQVLSELADDYERDSANEIRDTLIGARRLEAVLAQRGCEHFDSAGDGTLTSLCDIVIDG